MKNKRKTKNQTKGITLIALVVTIVILLILAGVSINLVLGPNGLITKAQEAALQTDEAQEREGIEMAITSSKMEDVNTLEISKTNLEKSLREQFGNNKDFTVTDNGDGSFLISINDTQRMYYVNEDGKVINNNNILKITSSEELENFRDEVNKGNSFENKAILLMNDINLNENFIPIGYISDENIVKFNGIFDGLNHKINNLNINNPQKSYQGLFASIGSNAKINNLVVRGSVIGGKYVGAIVGYNEGNITNCGNEANILSEYNDEKETNTYIGGIAGYNFNGNIDGCYNKGNINANKSSTGGITAKSENGEIKNCYNIATITSTGEKGGICGIAINTKIYNVYNSGNIISSGVGIGGIVGKAYDNSHIKNVYNVGQIQGKGNMGGIAGSNRSSIFENCYNKSNIVGTGTAAGIVGQLTNNGDNVKINNCFHYGNVETPGINRGVIVGIISYENDTRNCEWYTDNQEYYNSMIGGSQHLS